MAFYDEFITKWNTLTGTTQEKLDQINALTVSAPAQKALLTPSQILNACVPADLAALAQLEVLQLTLLLSGSTVDVSQGTTIRLGVQNIFTGSVQTLQNLAALVAQFDSPTQPWWKSVGYTCPFGMQDVEACGLS